MASRPVENVAKVIRRLTPADGAAYQALRLEGLRLCPAMFGSSYEVEAAWTPEEFAQRLRIKPGAADATFGAFVGGRLAGTVTLEPCSLEKAAHNAYVCGMYVAPDLRRQRIGSALLGALIAHARGFGHLRNLRLGVNAGNVAAITLYQSHGFVCYGLEPECFRVDGVYHDEAHYTLALRQAPG